ncbi:predicted protein [Postia placenta Mad-698-R]|uniref:C2H2-type domain-containing protein n=1 Tax=Postia placenta MAD-698-R-SB12 TaxID=670580 RepID=A0A1X6N3N9_9APHY|nr:hypothetical protein POSPLADRAFT_1139930 [Postia placenta MAD-698-R-SB12]EED85910.1 predicted protein [Postia placenta Mad-698-R]OSX63224.1 hypothetical protein POSPLADRAFT_1139930 [Postia placenta MAD-698-R-SB12]
MSSPYFYAPMPGDTATNYLLLSNAETDKRIYPHFVLENVAYRQQATGSASYNGHGLAKSMDSFEPEVRQRSVHEDLSSNGIAPVEAACGSHSVQTPHNMPTIEMFSWPAHSQSYVKTSPTINEGACTTLGPDPFAHIDLSILEMIASGSGINDCDEEPSRFTSTGQEVCNTQHINSISEDATESEGHVGVSLLAESTAPAYRLAQPRAPARGRKARKTPRRPRAPAVKATRPQATSKGTLRCEMCDRDKDTGSEDYAHQASLNRHIRTSHLDRSRWQCTLCDKSMVRSDALGRHLKRQHHMPEADAKAVVAHAIVIPWIATVSSTYNMGPGSGIRNRARGKGKSVAPLVIQLRRQAAHGELRIERPRAQRKEAEDEPLYPFLALRGAAKAAAAASEADALPPRTPAGTRRLEVEVVRTLSTMNGRHKALRRKTRHEIGRQEEHQYDEQAWRRCAWDEQESEQTDEREGTGSVVPVQGCSVKVKHSASGASRSRRGWRKLLGLVEGDMKRVPKSSVTKLKGVRVKPKSASKAMRSVTAAEVEHQSMVPQHNEERVPVDVAPAFPADEIEHPVAPVGTSLEHSTAASVVEVEPVQAAMAVEGEPHERGLRLEDFAFDFGSCPGMPAELVAALNMPSHVFTVTEAQEVPATEGQITEATVMAVDAEILSPEPTRDTYDTFVVDMDTIHAEASSSAEEAMEDVYTTDDVLVEMASPVVCSTDPAPVDEDSDMLHAEEEAVEMEMDGFESVAAPQALLAQIEMSTQIAANPSTNAGPAGGPVALISAAIDMAQPEEDIEMGHQEQPVMVEENIKMGVQLVSVDAVFGAVAAALIAAEDGGGNIEQDIDAVLDHFGFVQECTVAHLDQEDASVGDITLVGGALDEDHNATSDQDWDTTFVEDAIASSSPKTEKQSRLPAMPLPEVVVSGSDLGEQVVVAGLEHVSIPPTSSAPVISLQTLLDVIAPHPELPDRLLEGPVQTAGPTFDMQSLYSTLPTNTTEDAEKTTNAGSFSRATRSGKVYGGGISKAKKTVAQPARKCTSSLSSGLLDNDAFRAVRNKSAAEQKARKDTRKRYKKISRKLARQDAESAEPKGGCGRFRLSAVNPKTGRREKMTPITTIKESTDDDLDVDVLCRMSSSLSLTTSPHGRTGTQEATDCADDLLGAFASFGLSTDAPVASSTGGSALDDLCDLFNALV